MTEPASRPWPKSDRLRVGRRGRIYEAPEEPEPRLPCTHGPECDCTRCQGFTPGPEGTGAEHAVITHGAHSTVEIQGRAREVADDLIALAIREDIYRPSFEPMLLMAATALVRVERAQAALAAVESGLDEQDATALASYFPGASEAGKSVHEATQNLRNDMRSWLNTARTLLNDLGLSPRSLAAISRDTGIGRASRATSALRALDQHLDENYPQELEQ